MYKYATYVPPPPDIDTIKKYTLGLLNKCVDENMNIIIEVNIKLNESSVIYDTINKNSGKFTEAIANDLVFNHVPNLVVDSYLQTYCENISDIFIKFVDMSFIAKQRRAII